MGLFGSMAKAGMVRKVMSEARKPKNQQKLKDLASRVTGRGRGSRGRGSKTER